jgi:hypothetical protein
MGIVLRGCSGVSRIPRVEELKLEMRLCFFPLFLFP